MATNQPVSEKLTGSGHTGYSVTQQQRIPVQLVWPEHFLKALIFFCENVEKIVKKG